MSASRLTSTHLSLIAAANATIDAVPPHSIAQSRTTDHTCAAAALASDGRIFTGINMFHYSTSLCAENTVLTKAAEEGVASAFTPGRVVPLKADKRGDSADEPAQPAKLILMVAVLSEGRGVISPCGRCRQILADYHPEIEVLVLDSDSNEVKVVSIKELLPYAWVPQRW
jgi:cytidine deaminase